MGTSLRDLVNRRIHELGWTQERLASESGMSQEWVSKMVRGKITTPRRNTLIRLAKAISVPVEDVIMAAGFASTRDKASAMLAGLAESERDHVTNARQRIEGELVKLAHRPDLLEHVIGEVEDTVEMLLAVSQPQSTRDASASESLPAPDEVPGVPQGQ